MSLSTQEAVRESHRLALQQNLTRALKTKSDWARFNGIAQEAATQIDAEQTAFRTDYHARLAEARQVILREQGGLAYDMPGPPGTQKELPSAEQVEILAMNRVQADHLKRINTIKRDELDAYQVFRTELRQREAVQAHARSTRQDQAKEAFAITNMLSPHGARTRSGPSRT